MVPTPLSVGGARLKPMLEIIPDNRFIVFQGSEHEAEVVTLRGVVRLHLPDSTSICKPRIRLEGKRKISWWYMGGISAGEVSEKKVFWNDGHNLGSVEGVHKVKAGTIEWPFEYKLSPTMPESVEGLRETFIVYHLHASVSRPGWNAKDIVAQEHIRIVRTLGRDSMEMSRSRVNADIWANKISYNISIPTDAVVFGTSITAAVELSPLRKGITLGKIDMRLMETVVKRIQTSEIPDSRGDRSKSEESQVAKAEMEFPEHSKVMHLDETVDNPVLEDEMYRFRVQLPLPKSLNSCRQDVDSHQVNITHRFKLIVSIHNPEGHISQLVCRLPVKLFISPNLPVDESNEVRPTTNGLLDAELKQRETQMDGPPQYGRHILDQIYSEIDPARYMSRAGSGTHTPFFAQSRSPSAENLASLNGVADTNGITETNGGDNHGSATPSILHSRLADLQERGSRHAARTAGMALNLIGSGGNTPRSKDNSGRPSPPHDASSYSDSAGRSPYTSTPHVRRASDEPDGAPAEIHQVDINLNNLSRVPSYNAAVRTPGVMTPIADGPPTYVEATSGPPSPIQRPSAAFARSGINTPNSRGSQQTLTNGLTALSVSSNGSSPGLGASNHPPLARRSSDAQEDESRLRMLKART